ncbi:hypothetical protein NBRC116583_12550 [Arenicella sp. 4NH20-0111]|uniref:DUF4136 domain-containing protein n=1 Tax=Arenicella sp. 4NH20-0111 TaxID=3127648 RepID=UPI00310A9CF0
MKNTTFTKLTFVLLFALLGSACSSTPKVFSDFDASNDFSNYKTFSWADKNSPMISEGSYAVSGLVEQRMTNSIVAELESKGFVFLSGGGEPDFTVMYTMGARDKIRTRIETQTRTYYSDPFAWTWGRHYYPHYYPSRELITTRVPVSYTKGSIAIDIFDGRSRRPVWHTNASKTLSNRELNSTGSDSAETARALLVSFPPR